jgi:hypothetical protein
MQMSSSWEGIWYRMSGFIVNHDLPYVINDGKCDGKCINIHFFEDMTVKMYYMWLPSAASGAHAKPGIQ